METDMSRISTPNVLSISDIRRLTNGSRNNNKYLISLLPMSTLYTNKVQIKYKNL